MGMPQTVSPKRGAYLGVAIFIALSVIGVFYAKWNPYYHKLFTVAAHHTLGPSIVSGTHSQAPAVGLTAAWDYAVAYFKDIWIALIVGLVMGAGVQTLLPETWLLNVLGKSGVKSAGLAVAAAIPSMMCTCCSAPIALSLQRKKVATGTILGYWLGNPVLNPATIVFMGFVLGWNWALLRIMLGVILVLGAIYIGNRWGTDGVASTLTDALPPAMDADGSRSTKFFRVLFKMSLSLIPEYILIVGILGAVRTWLFPAMTPAIGHSMWLMIVLAVAGTLFVIPTAGEIPIVSTLMGFGLGLGSAGTLMMTLPAISLPSMAMVSQGLPKSLMVKLSVWVALVGLATGGLAILTL